MKKLTKYYTKKNLQKLSKWLRTIPVGAAILLVSPLLLTGCNKVNQGTPAVTETVNGNASITNDPIDNSMDDISENNSETDETTITETDFLETSGSFEMINEENGETRNNEENDSSGNTGNSGNSGNTGNTGNSTNSTNKKNNSQNDRSTSKNTANSNDKGTVTNNCGNKTTSSSNTSNNNTANNSNTSNNNTANNSNTSNNNTANSSNTSNNNTANNSNTSNNNTANNSNTSNNNTANNSNNAGNTSQPAQNTTPSTSGNTHSGKATFYGAGPGGCCNLDEYENVYYTVAMNRPDYNSMNLAGAYLEVTDKDGDKINVMVTNELPEGNSGDLDLSIQAFGAIEPLQTGIMNVTWKIIPLPTNEPIYYKFKSGSSQYWAEVQVRNHRYPIKSVEYLNANGEYVALERKAYNYYCAPSGMGGTGPYTFRVTDMYGHVLIDSNIPLNTSESLIPGAANFPY